MFPLYFPYRASPCAIGFQPNSTVSRTGNNCSQLNSRNSFQEKFGSHRRKTLNRLTTKDSRIWNITHNRESTAVWNLKLKQWGSPLVQEKYREEKACDTIRRRRQQYNNNNNNNNNNVCEFIKFKAKYFLQCQIKWEASCMQPYMNSDPIVAYYKAFCFIICW